MKGLELSRGFYTEFGEPMLREKFPDLLSRAAAGLCGSGSECFGFDDDVSRDHDFEPGFCIFIPDDTDSRTEFLLERAYAGLPGEYMGFSRAKLSPVGGKRNGVIRIGDFFRRCTGFARGPESLSDWLSVPEYALSEAVNGEVFFDGSGEFSATRQRLSEMPSDVRLKKLAGQLLLMAQSGQYNYNRCLSHGDPAAAQLAVFEFVTATMHSAFLLNRRYMPYYKWSFRALRELPVLSDLAPLLEYLITTGNGEEFSSFKAETVEDIALSVIGELKAQNLSEAICGDLEKHAYSVNDRISDPGLRNENILCAV